MQVCREGQGKRDSSRLTQSCILVTTLLFILLYLGMFPGAASEKQQKHLLQEPDCGTGRKHQTKQKYLGAVRDQHSSPLSCVCSRTWQSPARGSALLFQCPFFFEITEHGWLGSCDPQKIFDFFKRCAPRLKNQALLQVSKFVIEGADHCKSLVISGNLSQFCRKWENLQLEVKRTTCEWF